MKFVAAKVFASREPLLMIKVKKFFRKKRKTGFTMIEILIAMAIIGLFGTLGAVTFQSMQLKARDADRKSDLQKIKVAFEDYYNDNECYPPQTILNQCNGDGLDPYLDKIPCDPVSKEPYLYVPLEDICDGYRLYAGLKNTNDPVIEDLGCDGPEGCGWGGEYNYGVASGVGVYDPDGEAVGSGGSPTPEPTPQGPIYVYACDASGVCNQYEEGHPTLLRCPVTYQATNCNNECHISAVRCN